jgi:hypothetical protein
VEITEDTQPQKPFGTVEAALLDFIETIEAAGGVAKNPDGFYAPVGDREWTDLGDAYMKACAILKREPYLEEEPSPPGSNW